MLSPARSTTDASVEWVLDTQPEGLRHREVGRIDLKGALAGISAHETAHWLSGRAACFSYSQRQAPASTEPVNNCDAVGRTREFRLTWLPEVREFGAIHRAMRIRHGAHRRRHHKPVAAREIALDRAVASSDASLGWGGGGGGGNVRSREGLHGFEYASSRAAGRSSSGKRVGWRGLEAKLDVRSLACEPEAGHVARPDRVRSASSRTIVDVAEARLAPEQVGRAAQQAIDTTLCHL